MDYLQNTYNNEILYISVSKDIKACFYAHKYIFLLSHLPHRYSANFCYCKCCHFTKINYTYSFLTIIFTSYTLSNAICLRGAFLTNAITFIISIKNYVNKNLKSEHHYQLNSFQSHSQYQTVLIPPECSLTEK